MREILRLGAIGAASGNGRRRPTATHTLRALTMIDPVTGWFEVRTYIADKNANTVVEAFNNTWLTRYPPRPQYIG